MKKDHQHDLSRRERQIMDVIYRMGEATAADIQSRIPDPPTYAAVRRMIAILEEKGHLVHRKEGNKFVYSSTMEPEKARSKAIDHLASTFFQGSKAMTVAAIIDESAADLSDEELDELARMIEKAKKEDR